MKMQGDFKTIHCDFGDVGAWCKPLCRYSLTKGKWEQPQSENWTSGVNAVQFNTKFGKNKDEEDFEYFIIMPGMKVENYYDHGEKNYGTKYFLEEIEKREGCYKVASILQDNDAPLEKQSELVAKFINKLKHNPKCKKIHVLGMSKCGTMAVASLKYLTESNLDKLNVVAYSAPYLGTVFASPVELYKIIDELGESISIPLLKKIVSYLQDNTPIDAEALSLLEKLKEYHWNDFSRSHMDYDISIIGGSGVPEEHKDRYDPNFLVNLFNKETLKRLSQIEFTNITTYCTDQTIKDAVANHNVIEGLEYLSSKTIFKYDVSDGVASIKSSKHIEEVAKENNIEINTRTIPGGHHNIASDKKMVKETIDKILEPKREKCKGEER